jgi:hypothetical protein
VSLMVVVAFVIAWGVWRERRKGVRGKDRSTTEPTES